MACWSHSAQGKRPFSWTAFHWCAKFQQKLKPTHLQDRTSHTALMDWKTCLFESLNNYEWFKIESQNRSRISRNYFEEKELDLRKISVLASLQGFISAANQGIIINLQN